MNNIKRLLASAILVAAFSLTAAAGESNNGYVPCIPSETNICPPKTQSSSTPDEVTESESVLDVLAEMIFGLFS